MSLLPYFSAKTITDSCSEWLFFFGKCELLHFVHYRYIMLLGLTRHWCCFTPIPGCTGTTYSSPLESYLKNKLCGTGFQKPLYTQYTCTRQCRVQYNGIILYLLNFAGTRSRSTLGLRNPTISLWPSRLFQVNMSTRLVYIHRDRKNDLFLIFYNPMLSFIHSGVFYFLTYPNTILWTGDDLAIRYGSRNLEIHFYRHWWKFL